MAINQKIKNAVKKNQLRKQLNEAIKGLEAKLDKNLRELERVETKRKYDKKNFRLIHDLFFARTI